MFLLWPLLFLYCLHIFANDLDMFHCFSPSHFYFFLFFAMFKHFCKGFRYISSLATFSFSIFCNFYTFSFSKGFGYISLLAIFIFSVFCNFYPFQDMFLLWPLLFFLFFGQLHFLICCVFLRKENDAHRLLTRLTPGVKKKYAPVVSLWMEQSLV